MTNSASSESRNIFAIRVTPETRKVLDQILADANTKELGAKVKSENVLALALSLIKKDDIEKLKAATLTNADKLELSYREHVKIYGPTTKDEFLGRILRGELKESKT